MDMNMTVIKNFEKRLREENKIMTGDSSETMLRKNKDLQKKLTDMTKKRNTLQESLYLMTDLSDAYEQDSKDYEKMKEEMACLTQQKNEICRRIAAITDISGLVVEIDSLIKGKLAPVRYSKALLEAKDHEIVIRNLTEIVETIEQWCFEIRKYLPNKIDYVEVIL